MTAAMVATHVHTHVLVSFANPYLTCDLCGMRVPQWHNNDICLCGGDWWNVPCGHRASITSDCPSWSPVTGCTCPQRMHRP